MRLVLEREIRAGVRAMTRGKWSWLSMRKRAKQLERAAQREKAISYEVVCPDGRIRTNPYTNQSDANAHAERVSSNPPYVGSCRIAPKPGALERALPPCPGGPHHIRIAEKGTA